MRDVVKTRPEESCHCLSEDYYLHLIKARNMLGLHILFAQLVPQILELIFDSPEFLANAILNLLFLLASLVLLILLVALKRKITQRCKDNPLHVYIKGISYAIDIAAAVLCGTFYTLSLDRDLYRYREWPSAMILGSWIGAMQFGAFTIIVYSWIVQSIAAITPVVYLVIRSSHLRSPHQKILLGSAVSLALLLFLYAYTSKLINYWEASRQRASFETARVWKKMLNSLPEGFLILDIDRASRYFNHSLKEIIAGTCTFEDRMRFEETNKLGLPDLQAFKDITVVYCDERLRSSITSMYKASPQKEKVPQ